MDILSVLRPRVTAPVQTEEIYDLFLAVSPTFTAVALRALRGLPDCSTGERQSITDTRNFYWQFMSDMTALYGILLTHWDTIEEMVEGSREKAKVQENLVRIVDELENRFVSRSTLTPLGFPWRKERNYPKLRALRRMLPDDALEEDISEAINGVIRIYSTDSNKREELLVNLGEAHKFFLTLVPLTSGSDSPCPKFSHYPLAHVPRLTKTLFETIEANWCLCKKSDCTSHASRKTRLHLTKHQRFETAGGSVFPNSEQQFRILFSTSPWDFNWQSTDVTATTLEYVKEYVKEQHEPMEKGLCQTIQTVKPGLRPRMAIYGHKLLNLRIQSIYDDNRPPSPTQPSNKDFKSLKHLLPLGQSSDESSLSPPEARDRLVLSFVLTTSLLHFFGGPWLQTGFCSDSICFLASNDSSPDITKPYLTTNCSASLEIGPPSNNLAQPHPLPDILSLGILLLEVAQGYIIKIPQGEERFNVAWEHLEKWRSSEAGVFRPMYDCLHGPISACITPRNLREYGLYENVNERKARKYIFEKILWPLETAFSNAYNIKPFTLTEDIAPADKPIGPGSFDHKDENSTGMPKATKIWLDNLEGVHQLLRKYEKRASPVKVAVLDTGLQIRWKPLQIIWEDEQRINKEQSENFLPSKGKEATCGWNVDCDGHGSRVGEIILRVAPEAVLHVAKVFRRREDLEDHKMAEQVHKQIAEAIERASHDWKVDMIVMSFGFDKPIPSISDVIDKASGIENPPLFFAATGNNGDNNDMAWPARDSRVFGISSTDGYGTKSKFNPTEKTTDSPILHAIGEGIPISTAKSLEVKEHVSGTSYATPVAAALVANLVGCIRMAVVASDDGQDYVRVPERLRKMRAMVAVLEQHMKKNSSLLPWDFLNVYNHRILEAVDKTLKHILG